VRVLLIAPDQRDLNTVPEIRIITQKHHVTLLNGVVTAEDVYAACRIIRFQVIHFATHSNAELVALSGVETLAADDIAQLDRMTGAECIVFNSCLSGKLASYCVAHGASYCIYSNVNLPDNDAWKFPAAFYDALSNGHSRDVVGSFAVADSGSGDYGLAVSLAIIQRMADSLADLRTKLEYALAHPAGDTRIGVSVHTLTTVGILNGGFLALILYLLFVQH